MHQTKPVVIFELWPLGQVAASAADFVRITGQGRVDTLNFVRTISPGSLPNLAQNVRIIRFFVWHRPFFRAQIVRIPIWVHHLYSGVLRSIAF